MAETRLNSIIFPGLDNKYIVLSTEILSQMLQDVKTNGGIAYKDELINTTEIKREIIGSSNDKDFISDTGDKTLYSVYNESVKINGEAKKYAQEQDKIVLQQTQKDLADARAQLEQFIAENLETAKQYTNDTIKPVQTDLNTTKTTVESQGNSITSLNTQVNDINTNVNTLSTDLSTVKQNITTINTNVNTLNDSKLDKTALKIASTEDAGIVKIDGKSIVIQNGVISAVQGGEVPVGTMKCTIKTWSSSGT